MPFKDSTTQPIITAVNQWSNAFHRIFVPSNLLDKSDIISIDNQFAVVSRVAFLYGERVAKEDSIPLMRESLRNSDITPGTKSLWEFEAKSGLGVPTNMTSKRIPEFYIKTGEIFVCRKCHGTGQEKCWRCHGRGMVKKQKNNRTYWEPCPECGSTGYKTCRYCLGYRLMAKLLKCETVYNIWSKSIANHDTGVEDKKIIKADGETIVDIVQEYPLEDTIKSISNIISTHQFDRIHELVRNRLTELASKHLKRENIVNLSEITRLINESFHEVRDIVKENKPLVHEVLLVRVKLSVYSVPIHRVLYKYKDKQYEMFVYGKQNRVHAAEYPSEFTEKALIVLFLVLVLIVIVALITTHPNA